MTWWACINAGDAEYDNYGSLSAIKRDIRERGPLDELDGAYIMVHTYTVIDGVVTADTSRGYAVIDDASCNYCCGPTRESAMKQVEKGGAPAYLYKAVCEITVDSRLKIKRYQS